jgi:hypothetical protein
MIDLTQLLASVHTLGANIKARLSDKLEASEKGAANGVATLDATSHVPVGQIPPHDVSKLNSGVLPLERGGTAGFNMAARNIVISTAPPSGGQDGDIWLTYS